MNGPVFLDPFDYVGSKLFSGLIVSVQSLERDLNEILDRLERSRLEDLSSVHREELFARFCFAALLGLLAEAIVAWLVIRRFP